MNDNKALATMTTHDIGIMELGGVLAKSGFFADSKDVSKAVVKVLAGRELGFGPIASMTGIYIIKGKPSISANMMGQAVKRSDRYDYRVVELTPERCEIVFLEGGQEIGRSVFTKENATKAGTQNMAKFARNMLFSRAMSNGVKWFCPDVFHTGVYTPEEMGVPVDAEGDVIEGTFTTEKTTATQKQPPRTQAPTNSGNGGNGDVFRSKSQAIDLAMTTGVFEHQKHAENSWAAMWREHSPADLAEASPLWREKIANKLADKELAESIDEDGINRILSGDDPNPVEEL